MCISRLFLCFPVPVALACGEVESALRPRSRTRGAVLASAASAVGIVAVVSAVHRDVSRVIANLTLTAFSLLMLRAIQIERAGGAAPRTAAKKRKRGTEPGDGAAGGWAGACAAAFVALATFYSIGMPVLGLGDVGMSNMFAHLKVHAGSSHYILPVRWSPPPGPARALPCAGG